MKGGLFGDNIKWNFAKFLVDKEGNVVDRYAPTTSPLSIEVKIKSCHYVLMPVEIIIVFAIPEISYFFLYTEGHQKASGESLMIVAMRCSALHYIGSSSRYRIIKSTW